MQNPDVMPLNRMEELLVRSALSRYGTTLEGKRRAARALNISLGTLYNKVKRYNVNN
ncbi:helix-turn-helix domain-containing protein [Acididesulfobacillus acetoxydans]|uniref:helix-turn-helix domain-containing protein n=1 Tax=Acididesulfobacillus acetoxydans TaxID=1561005 RepID=UPI001F10D537|nr:helix-turn-helix domain-containing protein [Acididesulfobacillus acetoxydans]